MTTPTWRYKPDRWLTPLAILAALIGFFGPWIPHKGVALIVTGFELSEFAKFFPEVQTGAVPVNRPLFLVPLAASALILGLWTHVGGRGRAVRIGGTALAALVALAALPPYEGLRAPQYRAQLVVALGGGLLALLTPLTRRWTRPTRYGLAACAALVGLLGPLSQFARLHPLVEVLYNRPVGVGWGLILFAVGLGVTASWAVLSAIVGARPRHPLAGPEAPDQSREGVHVDDTKGIVLYGTAWCPDCHMARRVLDREGVSYEDIDIDKDPSAAAYVQQVNRGFRSVPTIVFPDGSILVEPSRAKLREKLSSMP